jgi:hypothetical protein
MRYIFVIIMGHNLYNMIFSPSGPMEGESVHEAMMTIYWSLTFLSLFFMSLSIIRDDLRYIRPSYAILSFSNILGIYDFSGKNADVSD